MMWSASIRMLERASFAQENVALQHNGHNSSWAQGVLLPTLWLPIVCILSIPTTLYSLTLSLPPGENLLGFGSRLISTSHYSIGIVVIVISGYIVPKLALKVAQCVYPPFT